MKKSTSNQVALFVMGAIACAVGALIFGGAKSAIHEIEALVLFLIGAVLYGSGSVVRSLDRIADGTSSHTTKPPN